MTVTDNNYAEALFILAREENCIDDFYNSLKIAEASFKDCPEYLRFLSTPSIEKCERISALDKAFGGKINDYVLSFLKLLCEHGKAESFFDCVSEYERLREWASHTAVATVKSAVCLNETQKQKLVKSLERHTGKTITLKCVTDTSVIGGVEVEVDGEVLDGTIKNNLKRTREVIGV